jgi:hypothetical protein
LPADASWKNGFLVEAQQFDGLGSTHDDQIDPMMDAIDDMLLANSLGFETL